MGKEENITPNADDKGALELEKKAKEELEQKNKEEKLQPFNEHPDWKKLYRSDKEKGRKIDQLEEDLESLLHVSELKEQADAKPGDIFKVGDKIKVKIAKADAQQHKIALTMKE